MTTAISRALKKIELPADQQTSRWSNEDIRPVPPERQTWSTKSILSHSDETSKFY